jgi:hypothetical protein
MQKLETAYPSSGLFSKRRSAWKSAAERLSLCPHIMPWTYSEASVAVTAREQYLGKVWLRDKKIEALALVNERTPVAGRKLSAFFHQIRASD